MNLMFTTYCNQKCPYCFGQDAMDARGSRRSDKEISEKNLQFVLDFIKRSGHKGINIIGGEPTLHPEFKKRYRQIEKAGLSVMIFSNCVMGEDTAVFLSKKKSLTDILLNIREPWEYSTGDWNKIRTTLKHIKQVTLSFRIYRVDFDITFLFDLIDEFSLNRRINFAPALPSLYVETKYLPLDKYKEASKKMVAWSIESKRRGISWYSDSGFILCAFSKRDLSRLWENVRFIPNVNCVAAVEVQPNLNVQRCFGMWSKTNEKPMNLNKFDTVQETHRYFDIWSLAIKKRYGALKACKGCKYFHSGICGGGCLVHILKKNPALCKDRIFS